MKGRQQESTGFSGSRLRDGDQVFLLQGNGPRLRLNDRWLGESGPGESTLESVVKGRLAKVFKGGWEFRGTAFRAVPTNGNTVFLTPCFGA